MSSNNETDLNSKSVIMGQRILLRDHSIGNKLFKSFLGKPIGISKPSPMQEYALPFILSIYDSIYLCRKNIADLNLNLRCQELLEKLKRMDRRLWLRYRVYEYLRDRGYIVRSGIKFGTDFSVYELGPGLEHAPYVVTVIDENADLTPIDIVRLGRVSHSVRKKSVLAIASDRGDITFLVFKWIKL